MARRVSTWIHVAFRVLFLVSAVALLVISVYEAVKWGPIRHQKIYPVVISSAVVAILVDISSIAIVIRAPSWMGLLAFLDVIVLVLSIVGTVSIPFSDYHYSDMPEPRPTGWQDVDSGTLVLSILSVCERVIALILICIFRCGRPKKKKQRGGQRLNRMGSQDEIPTE